jgi:hypothetical protein
MHDDATFFRIFPENSELRSQRFAKFPHAIPSSQRITYCFAVKVPNHTDQALRESEDRCLFFETSPLSVWDFQRSHMYGTLGKRFL